MFYNLLMDNLGGRIPLLLFRDGRSSSSNISYPALPVHTHLKDKVSTTWHFISSQLIKKFLSTTLEFDCERSGTGEFALQGKVSTEDARGNEVAVPSSQILGLPYPLRNGDIGAGKKALQTSDF